MDETMKNLLTGRAANLAEILDQALHVALHELTPGFRKPHSNPVVRARIAKQFKKNKIRRKITHASKRLNQRRSK
jgi:hypothetical protein